MLRRCRLSCLLLGLIVPLIGQGTADWTKVKDGITAPQAADILGEPLVRTYGRGFEVWLYDGKGEIVFAGGPAMGWTVPAPTAESLSRPVAQDVLIRPAKRLPALRSMVPQAPQPYDVQTESRFRYKQR